MLALIFTSYDYIRLRTNHTVRGRALMLMSKLDAMLALPSRKPKGSRARSHAYEQARRHARFAFAQKCTLTHYIMRKRACQAVFYIIRKPHSVYFLTSFTSCSPSLMTMKYVFRFVVG